ncbi:MAG: tetratricopeptide repeat protein [Candidatus Rokuibacteriota bacterium]
MDNASGAFSPKPRAILCGLAISLAGLVYLNALHNPFVYDDHRTIVDNPSVRGVLNLWTVVFFHVFRPVVNVSYALDYAVWGSGPFGYHLTSLLLHAANVGLLFHLTRQAVEDARIHGGPARVSRRDPVGVAFTAAALIAVHPLMTEAVAYASGRAEVLCGTFFLLALVTMRKALHTNQVRWYALSLGFWALALGSKEVAIMFPVVVLLYDRWLLGGSTEARRRRLRRLHAPLLGFLVLVGAARLVVFLWIETQPPPVPPWQYALMELEVIWRYLFLLIVPLSQSIVHTVRVVTTPFDASALLAGAGLGVLMLLVVRLRHREPLVAFGVAWFLFLLAPSSSLIPLNEAMAEHRVYLASCGFFMAVAAALSGVFARLSARGVRLGISPRTGLALVLAALSVLTVARNRVWADPVTLWRDATRKAPDTWLPHYALGDALRTRGACAEAIPAYQTARRLRPQEPLVYANLGACLIEVRQFAAADEVLSSALRIDPRSVRAHNNRGVLALLTGNPDEARRHFLEALAHDPRHVSARQNLAALYETTFASPADALRLCQEIQRIAPHTTGVEECIRRNQGRLGLVQ